MFRDSIGHKVRQQGAHCSGCHKKMGHGTFAILVRHELSCNYYHPSCYGRCKARKGGV